MDKNKIWKLYDDKENIFFSKSFQDNENLIHYFGYDFIYQEIYNWNDSKTGCIYEMWDCQLNDGDVVVDLGANVGFFSVKASDKASRIISVDGSPESYSCLVENCKDYPNIQTLNASILSEDSQPSWLWSRKDNPLRMTLEQLIDLYKLDRIDFLKCDIEGGEYDLLKSLSPEILSKIDRIAVETHDELKNIDFMLPTKIRHTFHWIYNGGSQTMFYFVTPKNY